MPWEISIVASKDQTTPLGERDEVIAKVREALPGVVLQRPPMPSSEIVAQMPESIRDYVLHPNLEADFETETLSIRFYANDLPTLKWINAEVRGNGDPLPVLAQLCVPNGWLIINAADHSVVDLSARPASKWDQFRKWREGAFRTLGDGV